MSSFTEMALHKLVQRNYGGKTSVSIKYQNLNSFKEWMILLCQSILETRWISHLHGSALLTIPLNKYFLLFQQFMNLNSPKILLLNFRDIWFQQLFLETSQRKIHDFHDIIFPWIFLPLKYFCINKPFSYRYLKKQL